MLNKLIEMLSEVKTKKPLVHHITNYVTVNECANVTLAIGGSPIMADDIGEVEEIVSISSALVLNIGTLNERTIEASVAAGKKANALNKPVILDPVGAGASDLRNNTVKTLLKQVKFSVIRGNMSEIKYIAGVNSKTNGVDASEKDMQSSLKSGEEAAAFLAGKYNCTVAITGETDIICDGKRILHIKNGHKTLGLVTGTGCMCSSLIGSFCSVTKDYIWAAAAGIISMGIAGEIACQKAGERGLGSFRMLLIDEISRLNAETISARARIHETQA